MRIHGTLFMRKARGKVRTFIMGGSLDDSALAIYVRLAPNQKRESVVFGFATYSDAGEFQTNEFQLIKE
jgi:hypothetical protein